MKPALRWLPSEVWMDILCFPWISRQKLGKLVDKIGNRQFAEFLQEYLHKWGKRTLKCVLLCQDDTRGLCFPLTAAPMPENIKFYKPIEIHHCDTNSLNFLRQVQTLFREVNLQIYLFRRRSHDGLASLRAALPHLLPLFHDIHSLSLTIDRSAIPLLKKFFAKQLAQIKLLSLDLDNFRVRLGPATIQTCINFALNWLNSEERDGAEPRLLEVEATLGIFQQFSVAIQQHFHAAKTLRTFAVQFLLDDNWKPIPDFHLENALGEQLHGQEIAVRDFQISRHRANAGKGLQEWVENVAEKSRQGYIEISPEMSIGRIRAITANGNNGNKEDGPSTSKRRKLAA